MKTKAEFIVNFFLSRNIFSKREFELISISINFWTRHNRVPYIWIYQTTTRETTKTFSYLLIFDAKLVFILNRKPFTTSVYLKVLRKRLLEWRVLEHIEHLSFYMSFSSLQHSNRNRLPRNNSSRNHDSSTIFCMSQTLSTKDEFFNMNGRKNLMCCHNEKDKE